MNETPELLFATSVHSRDKPPGRIGGCVGTFLHLFEWNPRKRLFSTKRLPAERPGKPTKKKFKDERMPVAKLLLLADEENRGGFPSPKKLSAAAAAVVNSCGDRPKDNGDEHAGKRVPGVVARLMGLESLPECNYGSEGKDSPQQSKPPSAIDVRPLQELLHARQEPVLLQDLLREREYLEAKKLSLKERLAVPVPGFVKRLPSDPAPYGSYVPPRDGFRKSMRGGEHMQPYTESKYHKSLRPLRKSSRDLSDTKHLLLALSPRSNGEGLRPILLPSKVHNKLMSSPIKSPTKMGSRSARLLEAAVKILEPSLQSSSAARPRPPVRPSATIHIAKDYKDSESEALRVEERKERLPTIEKKVATSTTNAGRALKGQSMSRSWNGREETGRYGNELKNGSSFQDGPGRRRPDQLPHSASHSRTASPMRNTASSTTRNRGNSNKYSVPLEENVRLAEEVKTVVPQGFEEAYEGGLKPLNVGRREQIRLDKYDLDDRRISEKHIVSSLSVGNSPYSETSERGAPSFHDPLRRSGSTKEGPTPPTPTAARARFLRSKSVKEEKISKSSGGQFPHHYKHQRESKIKQEPSHPSSGPSPTVSLESRSKVDSPSPNEAVIDVAEAGVTKTIDAVQFVQSRPSTTPVELSDDVLPAPESHSPQPSVPVANINLNPESVTELEAQVIEPSGPLEKEVKETLAAVRGSSSGGLLSYSRLFGVRKNGTGERKVDSTKEKTKEKTKSRTEVKKIETSLVRSLLRRRITAAPNSTSTAPLNEKKKRGGFKLSLSAQPSPEPSECDTPGYLSEDCSVEMETESNCASSEGKSKERGVNPEVIELKISSAKCVDDVFPDKPPVDKGCLKLLEDETKRGLIEGFDFVADMNELDNIRGGILGKYAAQLMDDTEFDKMFSTGIVNAGSGRGGFSYSPLVEMEEQRASSVDNYLLEGGAEVEKCVSFLGRTSVASSPEDEGVIKREVTAAEELPLTPSGAPTDEFIGAAVSTEEANGPSTPEISECRKIEDREHIIERVSKKFGTKGRVVLTDEEDGAEETVCTLVGREDCGQPSPVSVLECAFEDETASSQGNVQESIGELDDEDLDEDQDAYMDDLLYDTVSALQKPRKPRKSRKSTPVVTTVTDIEVSPESGRTENEKIVSALLDISRIRRIDPTDIGLEVDSSEPFQEEEEDYVSKVLGLWEIFPDFSDRTSSELPVDPNLFDRLESRERTFAWDREKGEEELSSIHKEHSNRSFKQWQSLWLHRRLLFDSVNEALSYRLKYKYPDPWIAKPVLRPQPKGKHLVKEVYREIREWMEETAEDLDTIIEKDMCRGSGNWSNHNQEIAEIGLEIERNILKVMIEELVDEMMGNNITKSTTGSVAAY